MDYLADYRESIRMRDKVEQIRTERNIALVQQIPLDRVLTETDGPFVEQNPDVPVEPGAVQPAVELLASAHGLDAEEMRRQIIRNFAALVS